HRDVKPENVLLPAGGGEVRAKLSDFGLARHVVETESLNLTRAGAVLGTPLYMSPEQCAGAALDVRSDVYSLGATLYHALAGRPGRPPAPPRRRPRARAALRVRLGPGGDAGGAVAIRLQHRAPEPRRRPQPRALH